MLSCSLLPLPVCHHYFLLLYDDKCIHTMFLPSTSWCCHVHSFLFLSVITTSFSYIIINVIIQCSFHMHPDVVISYSLLPPPVCLSLFFPPTETSLLPTIPTIPPPPPQQQQQQLPPASSIHLLHIYHVLDISIIILSHVYSDSCLFLLLSDCNQTHSSNITTTISQLNQSTSHLSLTSTCL